MRIICIILTCLLLCNTAYGVSLTQDQMDNVDLMNSELKKEFPGYKGFSGTGNCVKPMGISEGHMQSAIDAMDFDQLKKKDPFRKERKKVRNKLKSLGFTDDELENMHLGNDIPDLGV